MFSNINHIILKTNEPLSNHNTIKIGGNAKFFISTLTIDALLDTLHICNQHSIPFKIIGNGSNLIFDDKGFSGAIIKYANNFKQIKDNILQSSRGCPLSDLISYTRQNNRGGFEFCIGVPAQLGGAIINNLGAYNQEISTYIQHITILKNNQIIYLTKEDCNFKYHSSNLQNQKIIILGATFNLPYQDKRSTLQKSLDYFTKRKNSQPLEYPNAGSVFKRENNFVPAKLIDELGLKGLRVGDAQISTKHAGFIVNLGNAKYAEILKLIEIIKIKIYEKYNIILNNEVEFVAYL